MRRSCSSTAASTSGMWRKTADVLRSSWLEAAALGLCFFSRAIANRGAAGRGRQTSGVLGEQTIGRPAKTQIRRGPARCGQQWESGRWVLCFLLAPLLEDDLVSLLVLVEAAAGRHLLPLLLAEHVLGVQPRLGRGRVTVSAWRAEPPG